MAASEASCCPSQQGQSSGWLGVHGQSLGFIRAECYLIVRAFSQRLSEPLQSGIGLRAFIYFV